MKTGDEAIRSRHEAVAHSRTFRRVRKSFGLEDKRVVDIGCGYGEYLALFGSGSVGITTTEDEVRYGREAGLDIRSGNAEDIDALGLSGFDAAWANNLFEHLLSPHAFLMRLRRVVGEGKLIIFGVPVVPVLPALMHLKRFRGALASNHINFFTAHTLRRTMERAGWRVLELRPFFFKNRFLDRLAAPLAPHLYAVAQKDPAFRYPSKKLKEWEGDSRYAELIALGSAS